MHEDGEDVDVAVSGDVFLESADVSIVDSLEELFLEDALGLQVGLEGHKVIVVGETELGIRCGVADPGGGGWMSWISPVDRAGESIEGCFAEDEDDVSVGATTEGGGNGEGVGVELLLEKLDRQVHRFADDLRERIVRKNRRIRWRETHDAKW